VEAKPDFLDAILAQPASDAPRLAFADWLAGQGNLRGEFIRVQCELARLPETDPLLPRLKQREEHLLATQRTALLGPLAALPLDVRFERGFIVSTTLSAHVFLQDGDELFRQAPLREICLKEVQGQLAPVANCAHLNRLERLFLTFNHLNADDTHHLAVSPHLQNLTTLNLGHNRIGDVGLTALAKSTSLPSLQHLWLAKNDIGDAGSIALAASPLLAQLETLRLNGNRLGDVGVQALAASTNVANLKGLNLSGNTFGDTGALALAGSPYLNQLQWLLVKKIECGTEAEQSLRLRFGARLNSESLT
jgi:uncharacterized protein (TIGR02996 family)